MPFPVIDFHGVSKAYPVYNSAGARLKELACLNCVQFHHDFLALRDISFRVLPGETFCVIGENGSGKSTLLQIIAGILCPTTGEVDVRGRVAALLELGSGFNPEFTGRDNVYLNAAILGSSKQEIEQRFTEIAEFAEIGEYIDEPVKTYSSGMVVRLAFSVAIHVDPEILLVDEALSVGDVYFRQRCMRKIHQMRANGVTIVFVSHSTGDVEAIGDRAMWIEAGELRELGDPEEVVNKYMAAMAAKDSDYQTTHNHKPSNIPGTLSGPQVATRIPNIDHRFGDRRAEIVGIAVLDAAGQPIPVLQPLSHIVVRISVRAHEDVSRPVVGFLIRNHMGLDFAGTNTAREGFVFPALCAGDVRTIDFHLQLPEFYPSSFSFSPAIADGTLHSNTVCDWIDNAIVFEMRPAEGQVYGYVHLPCRVEISQCLATLRSEMSPLESSVG